VPDSDARNVAADDLTEGVNLGKDSGVGTASNTDGATSKGSSRIRSDGVKYTDEMNKEGEGNVGKGRASLRAARGTVSTGDVKCGSAKGRPGLIRDNLAEPQTKGSLDAQNATSVDGLDDRHKRSSGGGLGGMVGFGRSPDSEMNDFNGGGGGNEGGSERRSMVTFEIQASVCIREEAGSISVYAADGKDYISALPFLVCYILLFLLVFFTYLYLSKL